MGTIVDGAVDDENGDEDDALLTLSRFAQLIPLPGAPKMSWETTATYGAMSLFWFGGEMDTLHKEQIGVTQHGRDHTDSFYLGSGRCKA